MGVPRIGAAVRPPALHGASVSKRSARTTSNGLFKAVLVLVAASGALAATARGADEKEVIGSWKLSYSPGDGEHKATLTVTKGESGLRATIADGDRRFEVEEVKFKGNKLTLSSSPQPTNRERHGALRSDDTEAV